MFESVPVFKYGVFRKEEINSLRTRIAELEEENRKLSLQLEKREDKTKRTVYTKQEVDRELNEARQRIISLENEIAKLKKETPGELNFSFSVSLSGNRLEEILFLIGSMEGKTSTLMTIYLAKDEDKVPQEAAALMESSALYLIEKIGSSTGKAVFYDTERIIRLVVIPTFPIVHSEYTIERRFNLEPLKNGLKRDKTLVINAHAGETFAGILENDDFVEHETIRSSVMGKHSKGGWSQKRFQSLVEEDVRHHSDKVRDALIPIIEKNKDIQYVIAGGEGKLIKMILEGYDYPLIMKSLDARTPQQLLKEVMAVRMYGI